MPRRKSILQFRKYLFVFFGIILIFIWLNHENQPITKDADPTEFATLSEVTLKPVVRQNKTKFQLREERLRKLAKRRTYNFSNLVKQRYQESNATNAADKRFHLDDDDDSSKTLKPMRYFVHNKKCKMPYADPFSRESQYVYNPIKLRSCTNETDLFTLSYNINTFSYNLRVNNDVLNNLKGRSRINYKCNYREIIRGTNSTGDNYSIARPRVYFESSCKLPVNLKGIIVECHEGLDVAKVVQQDAFPLVQMRNNHAKRTKPSTRRKPSVILIGLDSMSRMNFQRTMPETAKFVKLPGWVEMSGYNKMADNTAQNLIPILTGYTNSQLMELPHSCGRYMDSCPEKLPWIWKEFKKAGYRTALAEDVTFSAFPAFKEEPVDHYMRPLLFGMRDAMRVYHRFGYQYCFGRRLAISYVLDFCGQFIERYLEERNQPVFGLFWSCTFTHDFYYGASSLDKKLMEYFHTLKEHKLFDESIVIFLSDHGARYGDLLNLSDSFLEERLPMLHIYLPAWFRDAYPDYAQALQSNYNRLSSNYDLYNTLRHIAQLSSPTPNSLTPLSTCPGSQSLLLPLPEERGCDDACIDEHWCTCNEYIAEPLTGEIYYLGKLVIYHINRWMLIHQFNLYCQRILLMDMDYVEKKMIYEENGRETMYGGIAIYRVRFHVTPFNGKFETTVRFNRDLKTLEDFRVPDISRINSYANHSQCVEHKIAKKFCFCYPEGTLDPFMDHWQKSKLATPEE